MEKDKTEDRSQKAYILYNTPTLELFSIWLKIKITNLVKRMWKIAKLIKCNKEENNLLNLIVKIHIS